MEALTFGENGWAPRPAASESATAGPQGLGRARGGGLVQRVERLLLTPEEAGEVLGVSKSTVYDLMRMRLLASIKLGRRRLVPVAACRELVARMMSESEL